jgi:20S proteasome alpha/beta subunit
MKPHAFILFGLISQAFDSVIASDWNTQLERAFMASASGSTVIACQTSDAAFVLTYNESPTVRTCDMQISDNIVVAGGGIGADVVYLIEKTFDDITEYKMMYNTNIPLLRLGKNIASLIHRRTLKDWQRPFGVRLVLIGYDEHLKNQVYEIDPLGSLRRCVGCFIGPHAKDIAVEWQARHDLPKMALIDALKQCISHLKASCGSCEGSHIKIGVVRAAQPFCLLEGDAIASAVNHNNYDRVLKTLGIDYDDELTHQGEGLNMP